jgi:hypothetical protein
LAPDYYLSIFESVIRQIRTAPPAVKAEFALLLRQLVDDPYDTGAWMAMPLKDPRVPNGLTVVFDHALLAYQVTRDFPVVKILSLVWLPPESFSP